MFFRKLFYVGNFNEYAKLARRMVNSVKKRSLREEEARILMGKEDPVSLKKKNQAIYFPNRKIITTAIALNKFRNVQHYSNKSRSRHPFQSILRR